MSMIELEAFLGSVFLRTHNFSRLSVASSLWSVTGSIFAVIEELMHEVAGCTEAVVNRAQMKKKTDVNLASRSDDNLIPSLEIVTATFVSCSEADKVPLEGLTIKDKGKGNERESVEEKKHGADPSSTPASPHSQSTAVTQ